MFSPWVVQVFVVQERTADLERNRLSQRGRGSSGVGRADMMSQLNMIGTLIRLAIGLDSFFASSAELQSALEVDGPSARTVDTVVIASSATVKLPADFILSRSPVPHSLPSSGVGDDVDHVITPARSADSRRSPQ